MEFRPMRRFKQQLPDEECAAILNEAYRGFLSVVGDGGYPYTIQKNGPRAAILDFRIDHMTGKRVKKN